MHEQAPRAVDEDFDHICSPMPGKTGMSLSARLDASGHRSRTSLDQV